MLPVRHAARLRRHLLALTRTLATLLATLAALAALALFGRIWALAHYSGLSHAHAAFSGPLGWLSASENQIYSLCDGAIWAFHTLVLLAATTTICLLREPMGRLHPNPRLRPLMLYLGTLGACAGLVMQGTLLQALTLEAFGPNPQAGPLAEIALLALHILAAVRAGHHTLALEDAVSQTLNEV